MTGLAQAAAGLAVALGFALLGTRRTGGLALLCAAQAVVVALGALAQGDVAVALAEFVEAGAFWWLGGMLRLPLPLWAWAAKRTEVGGRGSGGTHPSPHPWSASRPKPTRGGGVTIILWVLAAGAILAALAATIPGTGLPLAVILLGLLLVASRALPSHRVLGIAAAQNGMVLAALAVGLPNWRLALVVVPLLPALAFATLSLGGDRARTAWLYARRPGAWIDVALCGLALLFACALPWQVGMHGPLWRLDALAALVVLLLAALAAAGSWARRHANPIWGSQLATLAGTAAAIVSSDPLLTWLGMTLATIGAVGGALPGRLEAWRKLCLGCTGLVLALFGTIILQAGTLQTGTLQAGTLQAGVAPLPASACVMLGYGTLAVLAPELTVAAAALILRMRGAPTDDLLLALGLAGLLAGGLGLALRPPRHRMRQLAGLAQGGVAVFACGLGTDGGNTAGLLQLSFLALTQCALLLARDDGVDRVAALAGLAGMPPFGLFPSLALVLAATAARLPWLLLPVGAGLAAVAWPVLLQLPTQRRLLASAAWLPLALLLIAGFAMPEPVLAWFRAAAQ